MARQRKLSPERKAFINGLIEHYKPETVQDVQDMLKDLLGDNLVWIFQETGTVSLNKIDSISPVEQTKDLVRVSG